MSISQNARFLRLPSSVSLWCLRRYAIWLKIRPL